MSIPRTRPTFRQRRMVTRGLIYVTLVVFAAFSSFPLWWMLSTALKPNVEIRSVIPTLLPLAPTMEHFTYVLTDTMIPRFFWNSVKVGIWVAFLAGAVSALAGYAVARFRFRGKDLFMSSLLFTKMFPWLLAMIPIYIIMFHLRLIDSHLSLIIIYSVAAVPFCTWMLKGYFETVPRELEEAALVDGCSRLAVILRVVVPVALPGIVAVMVYAFLLSLQEFMLALVLLNDETLATLPLGLYRFVGLYGEVDWGPLMAAAVVGTLPLALAFLYLQRYIAEGLTAGAIKG